MAQVAVDLVANEKISGDAMRAAKAMDQLAKSEARVQRVAKQLGTTDVKRVGKALSLVDKQQALSVRNEEKALNKRVAATNKAFRLREQHNKKQEKAVKELARGDLAEAIGLGAGGIAAGLMTAALAAGVVVATGLAVALAKVATEANTAKNNAQGMLGVLTAGRGAEALKLVDGLAEQLGMKFQDARDKFIQFRQAGADNKLSASMLKLVADLNTVDSSGKLAGQAIEKVLSHKDAKGNLIIKDARAEMELLAKQAGVAGTGVAAVNARFTTLGGALASLDNTKTKALEGIGERIQPVLDRAAGAAAKFFDEFLKSEKGQKTLDTLASGITKIIEFGEAMLPIVGAAIEGVTQAFDILDQTLSPIIEAIGQAFGGDKTTAIKAVTESVKILTLIVGGFAAALIGAAAIVGGLFTVALTGISKTIEFVGTLLGDFAFKAVQFGADLVNGLITGITGSSGKLYDKVRGLASGAWASFKDRLGIGSPSKAFAELGKFSAMGFEQGLERNAPSGSDVAASVIPSAAPSLGGGGGASNINVSITVNGGSGESDTIARAVRREVEMLFESLRLSRGLPA